MYVCGINADKAVTVFFIHLSLKICHDDKEKTFLY